MRNIRNINVIPVVVGALGSTSKKLKNCDEELGVVIGTVLLQKAALLGTASMLRKVSNCGFVEIVERFVEIGMRGGNRKKKMDKGEGGRKGPKTEQGRKNVKV